MERPKCDACKRPMTPIRNRDTDLRQTHPEDVISHYECLNPRCPAAGDRPL